MSWVFYKSDFNGDISRWDVSSVKNMQGMFNGCPLFDRDISGWDTSRVTDMHYMFSAAVNFNQDLSKWNVSRVTNMRAMFRYSAIDCDLSGWDVSNVRWHVDMFLRCPLEQRPDKQPKFNSRLTRTS